jgi:CheY-like chemotaxis protein
MNILLVEDNPINRHVVREMFSVAGLTMAEAHDGADGLRMVEAHAFDLVLMDMRMPTMDGLTALAHIRSRRDAKRTTPVIMVTADATETLGEDCANAGADDVLLKPLCMTAFFDAVGRVLVRANPQPALA